MQNSAVRLKAIKTGGNSLNPPASMTLNLLSGAISSLVTFTRATTATVTDWEGLIKNTKSGEARFDGMRRVENLLTYSQDFSNAVWNLTSGVTVVTNNATAPDGTLTADTLTFTGSSYNYQTLSVGTVTNKTYTFSIWVSSLTGKNTIGVRVAGTVTPADSVFSLVNLTTTPTRVSITRTFTSTDTALYVGLDNRTATVGGLQTTGDVIVWGAQLENVTGQTNQNPSEYVSTNAIRRNLLTYSQDFSNAVWIKDGATIGSLVLAPDNTTTATPLLETAVLGVHRVYQAASSATTATFSIYAKAGTRSFLMLQDNSTTKRAWFNLSTGVLGNVDAGITASIVASTNGFYRCSITMSAFVTNCYVEAQDVNGGTTYTGVAGNTAIQVWGAQFEASPAATAYQKVTDAGPQDFNNYQGAAVDGVQYFPYTNPNCIINGVITQIPTIAINSSKSKFAYNCVASGDYFSTPSATANQITGDLSLLVQVALDDWTPATVQTLVAKDGVTSQRSYAFNVQTSGALRLNYSLDGSTITSITSTASTGFTDGTVHFVGVQREAATGIVRFYTSEDGTTFTQLGTDQTGTAGNLFNSTTAVQFGNLSSLAFELNGKIYDSHIYTGLKFSGNTLGSELVTNGTFESDTGWTKGTNTTISGGVATTTGTGAFGPIVSQNINLIIGAVYQVTINVNKTSGSGLVLGVGSGTQNFITNMNGSQTYTAYVTSLVGGLTGMSIFEISGSNWVGYIDNISIKQVTPNTATASSTMVVDFDPSDWTGALGGNLALYSEQFDNAYWVAIGTTTITANTTNNPNGYLTADTLTGATDISWVGGNCLTAQVNGLSSSTTYTYSLYIRGLVGTTAKISLRDQSTGLTSGSPALTLTSAWQRVSVTFTTGAATTALGLIVGATNGTVAIWGAQLQTGSSATAYIQTTSVPATGGWVGPETGETWGIFGNAKVYQGLWDAVGPKSLLIEEARTNLVLYSDDQSNAAWTKTRSSISSNVIKAPDGTLTGDYLIEDATATSTHSTAVTTLITVTTATVYTYSVYLKAGTRTFAGIYEGVLGRGVIFNLNTGTFFANLVAAPTSYTITPVGGGWYRCSITITTAGVSATPSVYICDNAGNFIYTGDGTSGVYLWGAQLEAGAFATSYIPTTSAQVTRNADQASMTGTNFSNWFNASEGTIYSDTSDGTLNARLFTVSDGTINNQIFSSAVSINFAQQVYTAGAFVVQQGTYSSGAKMASAYKTNDFAISISGAAVLTDTTGGLAASYTRFDIGQSWNGVLQLNGHIRTIRYYSQRLPNTTLQSLTA